MEEIVSIYVIRIKGFYYLFLYIIYYFTIVSNYTTLQL